jgi:hypothetical protein
MPPADRVYFIRFLGHRSAKIDLGGTRIFLGNTINPPNEAQFFLGLLHSGRTLRARPLSIIGE